VKKSLRSLQMVFFILMAYIGGSEIGTIIMADDIVRKMFEKVPVEVLPKSKGK